MRIDLHAHSSASDGTESPADVVRRARDAGLDVLALTDHDTVAGIPAAAAALPAGLTLVPGAELSCTAGGRGLHLLAYLFDPVEPTFAHERELLRTDRLRRARAMVERLRELGAPVSWQQVEEVAGTGAVGRPHVAQVLADAGVVPHAAAAFTTEWIGTGGRAYVAKHALDAVAAVRTVTAAGGVCVLAHPGADRRGTAVADDVIAAMAAAGLAGLEVDHPEHDAPTRDRLRALAGHLGLLVTGSSDDHGERTGHRLGVETTTPAAYDALVARARGTAPVTARVSGPAAAPVTAVTAADSGREARR